MDPSGLTLPKAGRGQWGGCSQSTVRTAGEDGPLELWPSWARQWYEPASVLVAAGSTKLLLGPSRSRAPFRYQEKRVSGVRLRPLLQLSVTACPSITSAAGLMRMRATGRREKGRLSSSAHLWLCATYCRKPSSITLSPHNCRLVWASCHQLCDSQRSGEFGLECQS